MQMISSLWRNLQRSFRFWSGHWMRRLARWVLGLILLNPLRCLGLKNKNMIYDSSPKIIINNQLIPAIEVDESFKYLGAYFNASGLCKTEISDLQADLKVLLNSAMKPQQKLFCLNNYLIPKHFHSLIFSKMTAGLLKKADISIRKAARKIHLPHELPKAAFHERVADGGLGVPSLRFRIPLIARKLLKYRKPPSNLFRVDDRILNTINQVNTYFRQKLQSCCDGAGLWDAWRFSAAHSWVPDGTSLMSGSDFVHAIRIRYGVRFTGREVRGVVLIRWSHAGVGVVQYRVWTIYCSSVTTPT